MRFKNIVDIKLSKKNSFQEEFLQIFLFQSVLCISDMGHHRFKFNRKNFFKGDFTERTSKLQIISKIK